VQDRFVLAGLQMPPSPRGLVVVQVAQGAALRARPLSSNRIVQENVDFPFVEFQFHTFDIAGIGDPKNLGTKLSVLNGRSPLGGSPLQLHSAWAEDRAMLGSNPSADSGTKAEVGCQHGTPLHYPNLRIGTKAINPRGLGTGPQIHYPLRCLNSLLTAALKQAVRISPKR
jgi:hypothetical protein